MTERPGENEGETTMVARMLLRWLVLTVAVPLIAAAVRWLSRNMEARGGPTRTSRVLRRSADALRQERIRPARRV
jgi:hypothetical protein